MTQTTMAPTPSRIRIMADIIKQAIMCLSALLFLRALRALLSILLRGASSKVVGTSCTGAILFDFLFFLLNTFFPPLVPSEVIFCRTCSSGLLCTGWKGEMVTISKLAYVHVHVMLATCMTIAMICWLVSLSELIAGNNLETRVSFFGFFTISLCFYFELYNLSFML